MWSLIYRERQRRARNGSESKKANNWHGNPSHPHIPLEMNLIFAFLLYFACPSVSFPRRICAFVNLYI